MAQFNRQQTSKIGRINLPYPKYRKSQQSGIAEDNHPRPIIAVDDLFDHEIEMRQHTHQCANGQRNANGVEAVDEQKL